MSGDPVCERTEMGRAVVSLSWTAAEVSADDSLTTWPTSTVSQADQTPG